MPDKLMKHLLQLAMDRFLKPRKASDESYRPCTLTADQVLEAMTDEEKIDYISGIDSFCIKPIDRLGVPPFWTSDATSGVRGYKEAVTIFPSAIAMAATFNAGLIESVGLAIAREARALGISVLLAPGVNIARIPTCGRAFEYMGEDPFLASVIASSYIKGVQSGGVATTVKHFACNSSDFDRHRDNAIVDERTLQTIYYPAFKAAVKAGTEGVMTSYNLVNSVHASQSEQLSKALDDWGFKGFVISDWTSLYDTVQPLLHGVDLEMPGPVFFSAKRIRKALSQGLIDMSMINGKVQRILRSMERIGALNRSMFDTSCKLGEPKAIQAALQSAKQAITLLRNDSGLLPLKSPCLIVVAGRLSSRTPTGGGGSSCIKPLAKVPSLLQELEKGFPEAKVVYLKGSFSSHRLLIEKADAVIYAAGYGKVYESEAYDRTWALPKPQDKDLRTLASMNSRLVTIVHSGGACDTASILASSRAILWAYYLGYESSRALCSIIKGETSPSGRLPFSVPRRKEDILALRNMGVDNEAFSLFRVLGAQGKPGRQKGHILENRYSEGQRIGYRQFDEDGTPLAFAFGQGLSYCSMSLEAVSLIKSEESVAINALVCNHSPRDGSTAVLVYVERPRKEVFVPIKELKGLAKLTVPASSSKPVSITIDMEDLKDYDDGWHLDKGDYQVLIGLDSVSLQKAGAFTI